MEGVRDDESHTEQLSGHDVTRRRVLGRFAGGSLAALLVSASPSGMFARQEATPVAAPAPPALEWIGTLTAQFGPPATIGDTAHGTRMVIPVVDGAVEGPDLSGTLVPTSADWLLVRPDGVAELDARATAQMQDGALIYLTNRGYVTNVPQWLPRWAQGEEISPEEYYYVTTPRFETGAPQYDWLQRTIVVGTGAIVPGGTRQELFAVR